MNFINYCPHCSSLIDNFSYNFCPMCGNTLSSEQAYRHKGNKKVYKVLSKCTIKAGDIVGLGEISEYPGVIYKSNQTGAIYVRTEQYFKNRFEKLPS